MFEHWVDFGGRGETKQKEVRLFCPPSSPSLLHVLEDSWIVCGALETGERRNKDTSV